MATPTNDRPAPPTPVRNLDEKQGKSPFTYCVNAKTALAISEECQKFNEKIEGNATRDGMPPELAKIVAAWGTLPEAIRKAILSLTELNQS